MKVGAQHFDDLGIQALSHAHPVLVGPDPLAGGSGRRSGSGGSLSGTHLFKLVGASAANRAGGGGGVPGVHVSADQTNKLFHNCYLQNFILICSGRRRSVGQRSRLAGRTQAAEIHILYLHLEPRRADALHGLVIQVEIVDRTAAAAFKMCVVGGISVKPLFLRIDGNRRISPASTSACRLL